MRKFIGYVLAFLMVMGAGLIVAYSAGGEPVEFGNNTTTTCYVGGDYGEVNCTGNITGAYLFGDGSELTGLAGGGDINAVNTDGPYLSGGADSGAVSLLVNETYLNVSIDARATGLGDNESFNESYTNTLYSNDTWVDTYFVRFTELVSQLGNFSAWDKAYSDLIGTPTVLSNFTDDLGNRGYTHLGNFTDDLGYNNNTHLSNLTDDLGDRGYTALSNFTDDLTYTNDTWVDTYFVRFTELVAQVGNWTLDKTSYYTSTIIDSLGNWSADKSSYATGAKVDSLGNWSDDKSSYSTTTDMNTAIESANTTMKTYTDALDIATNTSMKNYVDAQDSDTTYTNGTGISLIGTEINLSTCGDNEVWKMAGSSWNCEADATGSGTAGAFTNITNFTGTLTDGKICIYDASQQIINCTYTDQTGAGGNVKSGDGFYTYNDTDVIYFNYTLAGTNLSVNSSDYWDGLGSPSDINAGDITDDGTFSNNTWVDTLFVRFTELVDQVGNWSLDKSSYTLTSGLVAILGNWSADKSDYYNSTETETAIESANTSMKGYVDSNPGGYTTNTGTVTSVATDDSYLTGGAITTTGTITFNTTLAGTSLATNSSDYWDNLGSPSDIGTGDLTDDGTWRLQSWDNITGIPHATPADSDVTHFSLSDEIYDFVIGLAYTPIADLVAQVGNWSADKTSYTATSALVGLLGNWSADKASYSTTTEAGNLYATIDEPLWADNFTKYNTSWSTDDDTTYTAGDNLDLTGTVFSLSPDANITTLNVSTHFIIDTVNITCFNQACDLYMNATDSCQYWPSGGKTCGA